MILGAALLACAIGVAPTTMQAIVNVESASNPLAIHVNKWLGEQPRVTNVTDAAAAIRRFVAMGYSVDIGLVQLNSRNLGSLGLTVEAALDPCTNLAAGAHVLAGFYAQAVMRLGEGQPALMAALSGYNTGDLAKGFTNGYVARYYISTALSPAPVAKPTKPLQFVVNMTVYDRPGFETHIQ